MTKNRTPTPVYLDPGMHPGLEVNGLNIKYVRMQFACCLTFLIDTIMIVLFDVLLDSRGRKQVLRIFLVSFPLIAKHRTNNKTTLYDEILRNLN